MVKPNKKSKLVDAQLLHEQIRNTNVNWNASAGTYIYIAFAESPFKYSNAR